MRDPWGDPFAVVLYLAVAHHHFSASIGDVIAVAAVALAWLIYRLDRRTSNAGEVRAATALLRGERDQFFRVIGPAYFAGIWTPEASEQRARGAAGRIDQVFIIPVEPMRRWLQTSVA